MKFFYKKNIFKILTIFTILSIISCSKDSDNQTPTEITVSTTDFSKTLDENPAIGQLIGTVQGSTNEGSVSFSITEQTPSGAFLIDTASGELKVADATLFDFETNPSIIGIVKVANGAISKNAMVTITLNNVNEDNVYEGNVYLKTQQEVIDFGANNYTRITGSMTIGNAEGTGLSDVNELSPLKNLERIDNTLLFTNNPDLTSTKGLNINYIGGQFAIVDNPSLISIEGFSITNSISNGLFISRNNVLSNLSDLKKITAIRGALTILSCPLIEDLEWLSNLTSVEYSLTISNCNSLTNIDGLRSLLILNSGEISISNNNALQNIEGLKNLNTNISRLWISNNPSLLSISGLRSLNIYDTITITNNNLLQSLHGLEKITTLNSGPIIEGNNSILNLEGLNNLSVSNFPITIKNNENLESLNGLNNMTNIWSIDLLNNPRLSDFCALQSILTIDDYSGYSAVGNAYNPSKQDIIDGNCSL